MIVEMEVCGLKTEVSGLPVDLSFELEVSGLKTESELKAAP
jgi:hypothetical protein